MSEPKINGDDQEIILTLAPNELSSPYMVQLNILKAGIVDAILEEIGITRVIIIKGDAEDE